MTIIEKDLERLLAVFRQDALHNFFAIYNLLKRENISVDQLQDFLEEKENKILQEREEKRRRELNQFKNVTKAKEEWKRKARKCPKCGLPLMLNKIITLKGPGNKYGWRSLWFCVDETCMFEEYSHEYADKLYTEIMEG